MFQSIAHVAPRVIPTTNISSLRDRLLCQNALASSPQVDTYLELQYLDIKVNPNEHNQTGIIDRWEWCARVPGLMESSERGAVLC